MKNIRLIANVAMIRNDVVSVEVDRKDFQSFLDESYLNAAVEDASAGDLRDYIEARNLPVNLSAGELTGEDDAWSSFEVEEIEEVES